MRTNESQRAASQAAFDADSARFDKMFRDADAIYTIHEDGEELSFINGTKVCPQLLSAYHRFVEYGYAAGLMP